MAITQVDLKRIIRVFPRRTSYTPTDDMVFVGYPPMIRPQADEVHIDCTFTWDKDLAYSLCAAWGELYPKVMVDGCAFDSKPNGFTPGMYVKQGVSFTTRGCNNQCPWCLVSEREGKLKQYSDFATGNIIQDNNILQSDKSHWNKVIQMLKTQSHIEFSGGLDARLVTDQNADDIRSLKIKQVFLACDTKQSLKYLRIAVNRLQLPIRKARCYVLIAFNSESISEARERLEDVYHAGALPHAQLFQPPEKYIEYSGEWKTLARQWSRPAIVMSRMENVK